jgi:hypothetical protein
MDSIFTLFGEEWGFLKKFKLNFSLKYIIIIKLLKILRILKL